ncbi:MAG: HDOD domain-containing protein, partial [Rhodoferax sp.]|nr:HDOD domain-containing protein [Rhodoferax sp.]
SSPLITHDIVIKGSRSLPVFPRIINEILNTLDDPDANLNVLTRCINLDPVITARVLSVANMAAVRGRRESEVSDIYTATSLVGMNRVRHIVMISSLGAFVGSITLGGGPGKFWQHNVAVGVCCQELALHIAVPVCVDSALIAGLLHDIGQLWLFGHNTGAFQQCWHQALGRNVGIAEIGAWLAEYWALPAGIAAAIRSHHAPDCVKDASPEANLIPLVHVAEVLSNALDLTGRTENRINTLSNAACLQLGLVWDADIRSLFGRMEARSCHANRFFNAPER